MIITGIVCSFIPLVLGVTMAMVALRAISIGYIAPFRMARINKPDDIYRQESPLEFWFWVLVYFASSFGLMLVSILGLLGKIKLR